MEQDGIVGPPDVREVLNHLGECEDPDDCPWDFNRDGVVDHLDVQAVVHNFGPCP